MTSLFAALKKVFSLMLSLIKNIFKMLATTIAIIIKKLGSGLLGVMGFIKSAILPFLQKLFMGPFGAALILAALTYMGLRTLAKDFIKGKKAQNRLRELRQLQKDGKLTPELEAEMKALEEAGVTVTMGEATRNTVKRTIDLATVQGLLDDPKRTDPEIQEITGVSREVLEAYREALNNRDLYYKLGIPVPDLFQVAQSFGTTVDRTAPTLLRNSQDQSNQTIPVSEPNAVSNETEIDVTGVPTPISSPILQQNSQGARGQSVGVKSTIFISSAEDARSYIDITESTEQSTLSTNSGGGGVRSYIASVINLDRPDFITGN